METELNKKVNEILSNAKKRLQNMDWEKLYGNYLESPTRHRKRRHRPRNAVAAVSRWEVVMRPDTIPPPPPMPGSIQPTRCPTHRMPQNCFALYHYQR